MINSMLELLTLDLPLQFRVEMAVARSRLILELRLTWHQKFLRRNHIKVTSLISSLLESYFSFCILVILHSNLLTQETLTTNWLHQTEQIFSGKLTNLEKYKVSTPMTSRTWLPICCSYSLTKDWAWLTLLDIHGCKVRWPLVNRLDKSLPIVRKK